MTAYTTFHAFLMWGFYILSCLIAGALILLAIAWCWDRWCRRPGRKPLAPSGFEDRHGWHREDAS